MSKMTTPRYVNNNLLHGINFRNLNDMEPIQLRVSSLTTKPIGQDHQHQHQQIKPYGKLSIFKLYSDWCSKLCLTGLIIGLSIGAILTIIVALPLGLSTKSAFGSISSRPIWVGTYQMDNTCDRSLCCCLSNKIFISRRINNQIELSGSASGTCVDSSTSVSLIQTMPIGFVLLFDWYGQTVRVILGQDNSYVAFVNTNVGYCSGTALRTSYNSGRMNTINLSLTIFMLLIVIVIIES